jgi:hypothetical protein
MKTNYTNSSYWLSDWDDDDILTDSMNDVEKKSHDLYKLASAKKAIANFVNIVTNDNIKVRFNTRGHSYTDGKSVVIGSNIVEPKDFDVAVGLALHEGSHIKLSNFELLSDLYNLIPQHIKDGAIKKGITNSQEIIKDLWNYVEDRRIDQFVFNSAPGYRDYYRKMYDKYFNDKLIDKALLSGEYTEETIESYMFRIINLHNKNTNLSKLKGLKEIYKIVDLKNILRLKSSENTFEVALELFKIIMGSINQPKIDDSDYESTSQIPQDGESGDGSSSDDGEGTSSQGMSDEDFNDLMDSVGKSPIGGGSDDTPTGGNSMNVDNVPEGMSGKETKDDSKSTSSVQLTDRQKVLLKKKIEKQKKFLDGEIAKKTVSKKNQETIEAIQESGSEVTHVGQNYEGGWGQYNKGTECIVVKKLTQSLFENDAFPMTSLEWSSNNVRMYYQDSVDAGIRLGTMLGKKLQVRGEDRSTVFNRQKVGKIDKRMISSLGFGNQNVFQFTELDSYKNANLHVSIDASGSMGGDKWHQSMVNVVALCKAVDMIQNLSIQVTFRTTSNNLPYIVMAYDSRVDKFSKVKKMFGGLGPGGTTPEGLCFEAIMKNFLPSNTDMDSYFLNLSDGEPYFHGQNFYYSGNEAANHTRKMVKMLEGMGIKTLSYFIKGSYDGGSSLFKTMYGNGAQDIDVTNANQISKTMNKLFLQK